MPKLINIGISYARASAINRDRATFRKWGIKARMRGVAESTIKAVHEQWVDGMVKLIITVDEWSEIQMQRG